MAKCVNPTLTFGVSVNVDAVIVTRVDIRWPSITLGPEPIASATRDWESLRHANTASSFPFIATASGSYFTLLTYVRIRLLIQVAAVCGWRIVHRAGWIAVTLKALVPPEASPPRSDARSGNWRLRLRLPSIRAVAVARHGVCSRIEIDTLVVERCLRYLR